MGSIEKINKEIWELWCNLDEVTNDTIVPILRPEFNKNTILFVGLNPSFIPAKLRKHFRETKNIKCVKCENIYQFHSCKGCDSYKKISQILKTDLLKSRKFYPYFERLQEVSDRAYSKDKSKYDHLDLFMWRATEGEKVLSEAIENDRNWNLKPFWHQQLMLTKRLIELAEPLCIAFLNISVNNIFTYNLGGYFGLERYGRDFPDFNKIKINGEDVPVIFFKQLSGGANTSLEERKELAANIKKILNHLQAQRTESTTHL